MLSGMKQPGPNWARAYCPMPSAPWCQGRIKSQGNSPKQGDRRESVALLHETERRAGLQLLAPNLQVLFWHDHGGRCRYSGYRPLHSCVPVRACARASISACTSPSKSTAKVCVCVCSVRMSACVQAEVHACVHKCTSAAEVHKCSRSAQVQQKCRTGDRAAGRLYGSFQVPLSESPSSMPSHLRRKDWLSGCTFLRWSRFFFSAYCRAEIIMASIVMAYIVMTHIGMA